MRCTVYILRVFCYFWWQLKCVCMYVYTHIYVVCCMYVWGWRYKSMFVFVSARVRDRVRRSTGSSEYRWDTGTISIRIVPIQWQSVKKSLRSATIPVPTDLKRRSTIRQQHLSSKGFSFHSLFNIHTEHFVDKSLSISFLNITA